MSLKRASGVPGLRAAIQAAPPAPPTPPQTAEVPQFPPAGLVDTADPGAPAREDPPRLDGPRPRPPKPIRYTLDLAPDDHRFLKRFAVDAEVNASVIVRALLGQLRSDPDLAARVRSAAWSE
jgi:hypothetical protein